MRRTWARIAGGASATSKQMIARLRDRGTRWQTPPISAASKGKNLAVYTDALSPLVGRTKKRALYAHMSRMALRDGTRRRQRPVTADAYEYVPRLTQTLLDRRTAPSAAALSCPESIAVTLAHFFPFRRNLYVICMWLSKWWGHNAPDSD